MKHYIQQPDCCHVYSFGINEVTLIIASRHRYQIDRKKPSECLNWSSMFVCCPKAFHFNLPNSIKQQFFSAMKKSCISGKRVHKGLLSEWKMSKFFSISLRFIFPVGMLCVREMDILVLYRRKLQEECKWTSKIT